MQINIRELKILVPIAVVLLAMLTSCESIAYRLYMPARSTFYGGFNTTPDGRYNYQLIVINNWRPDLALNFHIIDNESGAITEIPMPLPPAHLLDGRFSVFTGGDLRLLIMQPTENSSIFTARTTYALDSRFYKVYKIDIEAHTATIIQTEIPYRTHRRQIPPDWVASHSFQLYMTDIYLEGVRSYREMALRIIEHDDGIYVQSQMVINIQETTNAIQRLTPIQIGELYLESGEVRITTIRELSRLQGSDTIRRNMRHIPNYWDIQHFDQPNGNASFQIVLLDTYVEEKRIKTDVQLNFWLRQPDGSLGSPNHILLPINETSFLENDCLRTPIENIRSIYAWFEPLPTENPRQILLQIFSSTERLPEQLAYTFLVDIDTHEVKVQ